MKKLTTLFLSLVSTALIAQIPNPSFENWTSGLPDNWDVITSSIPGSVTQSTTAHAGTYAVSINSVSFGPTYFGGQMVTARSTGYFNNSGNPVALNGWYISNLNSGDELLVGTGTKCPDDSVAGNGALFITTNTAVYKQFSICYSYLRVCTSDSAFISFQLTNLVNSGVPHAGSYVIIDDLSFGACVTGVNDMQKDVTLEAAYPNPANKTCNIIYSIPSDAHVTIDLYDISGRKVESLLSDTYQTNGKYKLPVDVSDLANGIYIYRVVVDGQSFSQKLTIAK